MFDDLIDTIRSRCTDLVSVEAENRPALLRKIGILASIPLCGTWEAVPVDTVSLDGNEMLREGNINHVTFKRILGLIGNVSPVKLRHQSFFNAGRSFCICCSVGVGCDTRAGAEGPAPSVQLALQTVECFSAVFTGAIDTLFAFWGDAAFVDALAAAKTSLPCIISAFEDTHFRATGYAFDIHARCSLRTLEPLIEAIRRTESRRVMDNGRRRSGEVCATGFAGELHNKILPAKDIGSISSGGRLAAGASFSEWLARPFLSPQTV